MGLAIKLNSQFELLNSFVRNVELPFLLSILMLELAEAILGSRLWQTMESF